MAVGLIILQLPKPEDIQLNVHSEKPACLNRAPTVITLVGPPIISKTLTLLWTLCPVPTLGGRQC